MRNRVEESIARGLDVHRAGRSRLDIPSPYGHVLLVSAERAIVLSSTAATVFYARGCEAVASNRNESQYFCRPHERR